MSDTHLRKIEFSSVPIAPSCLNEIPPANSQEGVTSMVTIPIQTYLIYIKSLSRLFDGVVGGPLVAFGFIFALVLECLDGSSIAGRSLDLLILNSATGLDPGSHMDEFNCLITYFKYFRVYYESSSPWVY
jgi:hypothetical protein